jgi:hypothetical protein
MDRLNSTESIRTEVLSFEDMIIYRIVDFAFYILVHGSLVLMLGIALITVLAFNDIWPNYLFEFVLVLSGLVGGFQYLANMKLKVYPNTSGSLNQQLAKYFRDLEWAVIQNNKNYFHACKILGKSESHVYVIYSANKVLVSAAIGFPFPFSAYSSRKIEKDIKVMAINES